MYGLSRPFLFLLDAENAHDLSLIALRAAHGLHLSPLLATPPKPLPTKAFGLTFPNPVGLAAGLDKSGAHIDELLAFGFGFIEIGTVTPKPQSGNDRPRMFRLRRDQAIINRMGFNSVGVDALVHNVERAKRRGDGLLGINIGRNKGTPNKDAAKDYLHCLRRSIRSPITWRSTSPRRTPPACANCRRNRRFGNWSVACGTSRKHLPVSMASAYRCW